MGLVPAIHVLATACEWACPDQVRDDVISPDREPIEPQNILHCKKDVDSPVMAVILFRITKLYSHSEQTQMAIKSDPARISQPLIHGFRVLQAFTASEPALTLGQVASRVGIDSGTAFHLVQTLVVLGYVERIPASKQFRLTLKPLELGFRAVMQNLEAFYARLGIDNGSGDLNSCSLSELIRNGCSDAEPLKPT
jgi:DNA-binding MarR family transcriptional regulator